MAERLPLLSPTYVGDSIYLAKTTPEVKVNQTPHIEPVAPIKLLHTESRRVPIVVSDPDGHSVTLTLASPRPGIYLEGHELVIVGSMQNAGYGPFTILLTATDSLGATNTLEIVVTIDVYTTPPVIDDLPNLTLAVGESMSVYVDAIDPESHKISLHLGGLPDGSGLSLEGTIIRMAPNGNDLAASPLNLVITATDQWGASSQKECTLTVVEASGLANPPSPLVMPLVQSGIKPLVQ